MSSRVSKSSTKFAPKRKQQSSQNKESAIDGVPIKSTSTTAGAPPVDPVIPTKAAQKSKSDSNPIIPPPAPPIVLEKQAPAPLPVVKEVIIKKSIFGPSDPSTKKAPPTPTKLKSPIASSLGTAFGFSKTGPSKEIIPVVKNAVASGSGSSLGLSPKEKKVVEDEEDDETNGTAAAKILVSVSKSNLSKDVEPIPASNAKRVIDKGKKKKVIKSKKGKEKAIEDDVAEEEEEQEEAAVKAPKEKRAPAKAKPVEVAKKVVEEDDDENPVLLKKRKSKVARAKATKLDLEMFAKEKEPVEPVEATGGEEAQNGEANENENENENLEIDGEPMEEKDLPSVEPALWTMSQISTPRDIIGGRTSTRFEDCQKRDLQIKDARNARRKKMRDRASRIKRGEPEESPQPEAAVVEETEVENLKKDESRDNSVTNKKPIEEGEDSDQVELARLKALYQDDEEGNAEAGPVPPEMAEGEDDLGELIETQYAPQMRIVNGEMVLDDASLEVDRSKDARLGFTGVREVVIESANDRFINSTTWGKHKKTDKWTVTETTKFYDLLRQFGTDFEMIARLFPTRTRGQIKNKWMKEEKINSKGITDALMQRKDIDLEIYAEITGANLSGPIPEDPMLKVYKLREETEARDKEMATKFGANGRDEDEMVPVAINPRLAAAKGRKRKHVVEEEIFNPNAAVVVEEEESEEEEDQDEVARQKAVDAEIAEAEAAEKSAAKKGKRAKIV